MVRPSQTGPSQDWGCDGQLGYFRVCSLAGGGCAAWILRLVQIGAEGEGPGVDVMEIGRSGDLRDTATLGLTLAGAKLVLAGVQRRIAAAQARDHAGGRIARAVTVSAA